RAVVLDQLLRLRADHRLRALLVGEHQLQVERRVLRLDLVVGDLDRVPRLLAECRVLSRHREQHADRGLAVAATRGKGRPYGEGGEEGEEPAHGGNSEGSYGAERRILRTHSHRGKPAGRADTLSSPAASNATE